jgi:hypothetical protein
LNIRRGILASSSIFLKGNGLGLPASIAGLATGLVVWHSACGSVGHLESGLFAQMMLAAAGAC